MRVLDPALHAAKKLVRQFHREKSWDSEIFPSVIIMDLCNYCNLRCTMCARQYMTRARGLMDKHLAMRILDEIAIVNRNARVWMAFYGEPLIIKKVGLYEMICYAKGKGIRDVVLNSNGLLLDEEAVRRFIEAGLDQIVVGIDGYTEETYRKLRTGGDYQKVINNVSQAIKVVRSSNAGKPIITVQFIEMEENQHEKEDFIDYWRKEGATVKIRPKVSWMGTIDAKNLTSVNRYPCHWVMDCAVVAFDGSVVLCGADYDAQFIAGNVNDETLQSIWQGRLREIREMHITGDYESLPPMCRNCKDWQASGEEIY